MAEAFSPKITTENVPCTFDFTQVLVAGETISTATCTVVVVDGTDTSPSSILNGAVTINNFLTTQQVHNGINEVTYRLIMTITTSLSNVYVGVGDIAVYSATSV